MGCSGGNVCYQCYHIMNALQSQLPNREQDRNEGRSAITQSATVSQRFWRSSARAIAFDRFRRQLQTVAGHRVQPLQQRHRARRRCRAGARDLAEVAGAVDRALDLPIGPRLRSIHSRTTGSAVVQISRRGSKLRATPSTTTMVFCSSSSSGRVCMSNSAGDLEQQRQQPRHRDFLRGAIVDRLADGADRLREIVDRVMRRHIAGLEMHFGDAVIVAGDEAVAEFRRGSVVP